MLKSLTFFTILILISSISFAQNDHLLLYPSINKDGSKIAFASNIEGYITYFKILTTIFVLIGVLLKKRIL